MTLPVAVLISGRGSNMAALLEAMRSPGFPARPALVASNRPEAPGLKLAETAGVATAVVDHRGREREAFERELAARIERCGAELVLLAGFMRRLTPWFVGRWRDRTLNIHPSLLPSFQGLDTHARALAAGVVWHGCTVHVVREALDDGPVLGQAALRVAQEDDAETLAARVLRLERRLYPAVLRAWAEGVLGLREGKRTGAPVALIDT